MHIGFNAQLLSLTNTYRATGLSNYIRHLLGGLSDIDTQNHYTVFTGGWARRADASERLPLRANFRLRPSYVPAHYPPVRLLWEQTALPPLARRLDVLHSPVNVVPLVASTRHVVTIHDLAFLAFQDKHLPTKRLYLSLMTRRSARRADFIVTDSEFTRQDVIARLAVAPEKVITVSIGVDAAYRWLGDSPQGCRDIEAFRQQKGLPARYFLYLGTLEPRKNLPMLLRAYAALHAEGMGAEANSVEPPKLVIAGPKGWLYEEIFAQVRALGLEEHVLFPGFVPQEEVVWWYNAALGFVYLSAFEGFGLPVLQAMACGVPVIANAATSLPEVVGEAGLLVQAEDCGAVAASLRALAGTAELRTQLRARGLEQAAQFSWKRTAEQTLAVYAAAAEGKGKREEGRVKR
jgi:glycosyltransferase involved in cell wall biosynthesis